MKTLQALLCFIVGIAFVEGLDFPRSLEPSFAYGVAVKNLDVNPVYRSSPSRIFNLVAGSETIDIGGTQYSVPQGVTISPRSSCVGNAAQGISATSSIDSFYNAEQSAMNIGYDQTTTVAVEYPPVSASQDIRNAALMGKSSSSEYFQSRSERTVQVAAEARAIHTQYSAIWKDDGRPTIDRFDAEFLADAQSLTEGTFGSFLNRYGMYYLSDCSFGATVVYTMTFDATLSERVVEDCVASSRSMEFAGMGGQAGGSDSSQQCQGDSDSDITQYYQSSIEILGATSFEDLNAMCSYDHTNPVLVQMNYGSVKTLLELVGVSSDIISKWWDFASEDLAAALIAGGMPECSLSGCPDGCECSAASQGCIEFTQRPPLRLTEFSEGVKFNDESGMDSGTTNPIVKIRCENSYCKNNWATEASHATSTAGESVRLGTLNDISDSPYISNNGFTKYAGCPHGKVVVALQCIANYQDCGVLKFMCATPEDNWRVIVGADMWTHAFSEREYGFGQCPDGYVQIGLKCDGDNCSLKEMLCAPISIQTSVSCPDACNMEVGMDYAYPEHDMPNMPIQNVGSPEDCCTHCHETNTCSHWVFGSYGNTCWLKTSGEGAVARTDRIAGHIGDACNMEVGMDYAYPEHDMPNMPIQNVGSPEDCCTHCHETNTCSHWVFGSSGHTCWLKTSGEGAVARTDRIAGHIGGKSRGAKDEKDEL